MPKTSGSLWTREQLLVAFALYCRLPFGLLHHKNPEIVRYAEAIGRSPSVLAMKLVNIASLDGAITSTGRTGLRNASATDRAMWKDMHDDWERFAVESNRAITAVRAGDEESPDGPLEDGDGVLVGQDRVVVGTSRVGQSFFRAAILSAYNERCCITGLSVPSLLVASHIIPWSHDRANRVNPRNGLLLSALHDRAFDSGLITVDENMTVRVSAKHAGSDDPYFSESIESYDGRRISLPEKFSPDQEFLSYHAKYIFLGQT